MMRERIPRAQMSASERRLRSRLNQMIAGDGLLRGTLTLRKVRCGRRGCGCAEGNPHWALYLTATQDGKTRQMYVPQSLEEKVRGWLRQYRRARDLLEGISQEHWKAIRNRRR